MAARTEPSGWNWWCGDCAEGDGPYEFEFDADQAAARHNTDNHADE